MKVVIARPPIREIVIQKAKERGYKGLRGIAKALNTDVGYLREVLSGKRTARPTVYRIAKLLQFPELCYLYEEMLEQKRVEKKKGVSTKGNGR